MAVILTNSNSAISLATGNSHLIVEGVTQYNTSSVVTAATNASGINYSILGNIASLGSIGINAINAGSNQEIFIGSQGNILAETTGVQLGSNANDSRIVNNGSITGNVAVQVGGSLTHITNTGTMNGSLSNAINILDGANSIIVLNSGTVSGNLIGIEDKSLGMTLTNSGVIQGGLIGVTAAGQAKIINSGSILGGQHGIETDGSTVVLNTGSIVGGINFGAGDDLYDGRGGSVSGVVELGGGTNTYHGGDGADRVNGKTNATNTFYGNGGDDQVLVLSGASIAYGGAGNDRMQSVYASASMYGGSGSDDFKVSGVIGFDGYYDGGSGEDSFEFLIEPGDPDFFNTEIDFLSLASGASSETRNPHIIGFEHFKTAVDWGTLLGTDDNNVLQFDTVNQVRSFGGDDTITAGVSNVIFSGSGNDSVSVSGFYGVVNLGSGDDSFVANSLGDGVFGGTGDDRLFGAGRDDKLRGNQGDDFLDGMAGSDNLSGQDGNDILLGGSGMDAVLGGNGDDRLFGGVDDDALFGDAGLDYLSGGLGDDRLVGGADSDTFVLNFSSDFERVLDFQDGVDLIDLTTFNYNDATAALSDFVQQGSNVRIINGDDVMVISNALLADFDASDLIL